MQSGYKQNLGEVWHYTVGWSHLKKRLMQVCFEESSAVWKGCIYSSREQGEKNCLNFCELMLRRLDLLVKQDGQESVWEHSIPLFSRPDEFASFVNSKQHTVESHNKFLTLIGRYFDNYRLTLLPYNENQARLRSRIYNISCIVADHESKEHSYELMRSTEHQSAILDYIKENYKTDKNLPRTIKTLNVHINSMHGEFLSYGFCNNEFRNVGLENVKSCCEVGGYSQNVALDEMTVDKIEILARHTKVQPELEFCLNELDRVSGEAVAVSYGVGDLLKIHIDQNMTRSEFCSLRGLSQYQLNNIVQRALVSLRDCLLSKICGVLTYE